MPPANQIRQIGACLALVSFLAGPPDAGGRVGEGADPAHAARPTERLIHDLGSVRWRTREEATVALIRRGPPCYGPLLLAFKESRRYEVRSRIKLIAREIFVTEALGAGGAMLGILEPSPLSRLNDRRLVGATTALGFHGVVRDSAADRAGLRRGDLIVSLNGRWGSRDYPAVKFLQSLADRQPGTECKLGVLRGGEALRLDENTVRFDLSAFRVMGVRFVRHDEDPRVSPAKAGILIADAKPAGERAGLRTGDLIVALDDRPLDEDDAEAMFADWVRGRSVNEGKPDPLEDAEHRAIKEWPAALVLRGTRWLEVTVTLDRWPAWAPVSAVTRGRAKASALDQVLAAFEDWWRGGLGEDGLGVERGDAPDRWRLRPGNGR